MIMRLDYFFAWLRSRDETKIKNQSKQNVCRSRLPAHDV
jgi:hypothetical protein